MICPCLGISDSIKAEHALVAIWPAANLTTSSRVRSNIPGRNNSHDQH